MSPEEKITYETEDASFNAEDTVKLVGWSNLPLFIKKITEIILIYF